LGGRLRTPARGVSPRRVAKVATASTKTYRTIRGISLGEPAITKARDFSKFGDTVGIGERANVFGNGLIVGFATAKRGKKTKGCLST